MKKIIGILLNVSGAILILLFMSACAEHPTSQPDTTPFDYTRVVGKRALFLEQDIVLENDSNYPQTSSGIAYYQKGKKGYLGFKMTLPNGSTFWLDNGSLTPPPGTESGSNVTITMTAELDQVSNTLYYSFGPSGCKFDPPAEIYLSWSELNTANANLFLIDENGHHLETYPDGVDKIGSYLILRIPHFSRYAVAYSD